MKAGKSISVFILPAFLLSLAISFSGCASPETKEQEKALRDLKPIESKNPVKSRTENRDSDLLRALENMEPLSGVIWSYPKPSLELVKAPPGTNWHDRELIFWIKETITF